MASCSGRCGGCCRCSTSCSIERPKGGRGSRCRATARSSRDAPAHRVDLSSSRSTPRSGCVLPRGAPTLPICTRSELGDGLPRISATIARSGARTEMLCSAARSTAPVADQESRPMIERDGDACSPLPSSIAAKHSAGQGRSSVSRSVVRSRSSPVADVQRTS